MVILKQINKKQKMAEDIDDLGAEQEGGNGGEEALWKTGPDDPGLRVRVMKRIKTRAGNEFVRLEGVDHLVQANQIYPIENEAREPEDLFGEPVMWHKPGEDPIEVRNVAEQDGDNGMEIAIQVGGSIEWVPAEQIRQLGDEAAKQVVEPPEAEGITDKADESLEENGSDEAEPLDRDEEERIQVLPRGTKMVRRGKPGFEIETITKRPKSGKEYYVIIQKDAEGRVTARTNEDVDAMQNFLDEGSKWRLDEREDGAAEEEARLENTSEASKLTPEELKAQKAIVDYLTPRIKILEDRVDNPDRGDSIQLAKLKALMQKVQEGKFIESTDYSGINEVGKNVKGSHSVLSYFGRVKAFSNEGSAPHRNADNILNVLKDAGIDVDTVDELLAQEDANNNDQNSGDTTEPPKDNRNKNDNPHNKKDKTKDNERIDKNSTWLDPRRIQELKYQYDEAVGAHGGNILEDIKKHLKTIIIEREISRALNVAQRIKEQYNVGEVPAAPSQAVKERMAELMDESYDEINKLAQDKDDLVREQASRFKNGEEVKIIKPDGSIEDGWRVKGYSHTPNSTPMVHIRKGKESRYMDPDILRAYQEKSSPNDDKVNLERLKPFFNGEAKIKTDEGVVEGRFQGYRPGYGVGEGKVYYGDSTGKRIGESTVEDFLNWQNERLTAEVKAEEEANKLAELERKVQGYIGKRVKNQDADGNWLRGYKCEDYLKDEQMVRIAITDKEGNKKTYKRPLEWFIELQETPGGEDTLKDEEEAKKEAAKLAADKPEKADLEAEAAKAGAAKEAAKKAIPLSWWESTVKKWDSLPNNVAKISTAAGGLLLATTGLGFPAIPIFIAQHRRHHKRLKRQKEEESRRANKASRVPKIGGAAPTAA
jgi:hypothetical protein